MMMLAALVLVVACPALVVGLLGLGLRLWFRLSCHVRFLNWSGMVGTSPKMPRKHNPESNLQCIITQRRNKHEICAKPARRRPNMFNSSTHSPNCYSDVTSARCDPI